MAACTKSASPLDVTARQSDHHDVGQGKSGISTENCMLGALTRIRGHDELRHDFGNRSEAVAKRFRVRIYPLLWTDMTRVIVGYFVEIVLNIQTDHSNPRNIIGRKTCSVSPFTRCV